jgi:hypothetical protein
VIAAHEPAVTRSEDDAARALGNRGFWWSVVGITITQLALRGWAAAGGWFYWDDFWWHDIVAQNSLRDAAGLSLGGHYSPLTYIPYWLVTWAFPYEWAPRVVVMLVTLLGINAGVLAVVRRLWPTRGPQLAVYVLWAFSTLAAPSWLWYSQFSMIGALLLTSTWTLWAYLRALSSDDPGPSVLAVGLLVVSLFAQERMVVMAILMGVLLVVVCRPSMPTLRWRGRTGLWTASGVAVIVWVLVYLSLPSASVVPATAAKSAEIAFGMLRVSGLPALLGGPWLLNDEPVLRRAATPLWLQLLAAIVVVALVVWTVRRRRSAGWAWGLLGVAFLADSLLVVIGRGATLGAAAIPEWRYFSGLAVLAPLCVVAAFVAPGTPPQFGTSELRVMRGLLAVYVVSCLATTVPLGWAWWQSTSRPSIQTAIAQLQSVGAAAVVDRMLPEEVINPALLEQRTASRVFSIIDSEVEFNASSTDPLWLDEAGNLGAAGLVVQRRSPGLGECAYPVRGYETTWVPLPGAVDYFSWGVRIDYTAETDVRAAVTDGPRTVVVDLPAGRHSMYVSMPGLGSQLGVFLVEATKSICMSGVSVGTMGPG